MPTYTVTDPSSGKKVKLTGDSPPTESELNNIFSEVHGSTSAQQQSAPSLMQNIENTILKTIGESPIGMVGSGANAINKGVGKIFTPFIPVGDTAQSMAQKAIAPFRALGVGAMKHLAETLPWKSPTPYQTTDRTLAALSQDFKPHGMAETVGKMVGENSPAIAASVVSPNIGGPLAFMTQQAAETGKVSPVPAILPIIQGAVKAGELLNLKKRIVPPLLKYAKGVPTAVSKMALDDQSILNLPGTSESIQSKSQDIMSAINEASRKVGNDFGHTYKEQGLPNLVDEIINGNNESRKSIITRKSGSYKYPILNPQNPITDMGVRDQLNPANFVKGKEPKTLLPQEQLKSANVTAYGQKNIPDVKDFNDLRNDYHDAISGDLFKKKNLGGGADEISNVDKLSALTDLKRSLQDKAIYPQPGVQLSPSEGAYNTAIQKMASNIDDLRGKLPGGDKLSLADDAWGEMKEIKQRLISAFKDPYTGQDYLNRILKGNIDWLTSGRNAGRVGAIERVEQITGKKVLQPALKEMAAAYINNPDVVSLPSFGLKSIISSLVPTKFLLKSFDVSNKVSGAGKILYPTVTSSKSLTSEKIKEDARKTGEAIPAALSATSATLSKLIPQGKPLTESKIKEYLKKAGNDKKKAKAMAIKDGYDPDAPIAND